VALDLLSLFAKGGGHGDEIQIISRHSLTHF
jgi:hypothetical protein